MSKRTQIQIMGELEKLEHQRRNPHLYTTLSQCVNADGSITTFDDVTRKLQDTLKALDTLHAKKFGGSHPVFCMRPMYGQSENPVCQSIEMIDKDLDRCRLSFVTNYKNAERYIATLNPNKDTV